MLPQIGVIHVFPAISLRVFGRVRERRVSSARRCLTAVSTRARARCSGRRSLAQDHGDRGLRATLPSVPKKSKLVELLSPSLRQSLFVLTPIAHPKTEGKAIFFMSGRNATVTFALLVDRQIAKAFRPFRFESVPIKSKLVELLSPSLRQSFALALPQHPLPEAKTIFFMGMRYATVTFALLVDCQIAKAFRPVRLIWVPIKSKLIQLLSA